MGKMFDTLCKYALDGTFYAIDKLLEANRDVYTCAVRTHLDKSADSDREDCDQLRSDSHQHQAVDSNHNTRLPPKSTTINGHLSRKTTKRRIIKLRIKVSKEQAPNTSTGIGKMVVMSPPLSPTSLQATAECIPRPEYISICSSVKQTLGSASLTTSGKKRRVSVRMYRKSFSLATIFEHPEIAEEMVEEEEVSTYFKTGHKKSESMVNFDRDADTAAVMERGRA